MKIVCRYNKNILSKLNKVTGGNGYEKEIIGNASGSESGVWLYRMWQ